MHMLKWRSGTKIHYVPDIFIYTYMSSNCNHNPQFSTKPNVQYSEANNHSNLFGIPHTVLQKKRSHKCHRKRDCGLTSYKVGERDAEEDGGGHEDDHPVEVCSLGGGHVEGTPAVAVRLGLLLPAAGGGGQRLEHAALPAEGPLGGLGGEHDPEADARSGGHGGCDAAGGGHGQRAAEAREGAVLVVAERRVGAPRHQERLPQRVAE